jgi:hypothetical protein
MINKEEQKVEQMCCAALKLIKMKVNQENFGEKYLVDHTADYSKRMDVNGALLDLVHYFLALLLLELYLCQLV